MQKTDDLSTSGESPVKTPKIFISYSWTSPGHQERIRQWAERLIQDGIDVVLDIYDLREGHDKYTFMEQMVTDPSITHVLIMCDKTYSEKADAKKAGVGTESQIISGEVYKKVVQSKFIPIACELSEDSEPYLPTFLRSRIWIDFSSLESVNANWERLVRLVYGKPALQKPERGQPPAYIKSDISSPSNPATGKFNTFKQALLENRKGLKIYRQEFLSACTSYADALRTRTIPNLESLGAKILEDCGKLKNIRNLIIDWVLLESDVSPTTEFCDSLLDYLENLRDLKSRPVEVNQWNDSWFEAHAMFVYETFLYIVAALLRTKSFELLRQIFTYHYIRPKHERYTNEKFDSFGCFYGYSDALQSVLAPKGRRLHSPAAELIKRQADREDIPFSSVMEGELLILLMTLISPEARWYPQTLHYCSHHEFTFFERATQHKHFSKLSIITGIDDADRLREVAKSGYTRLGVDKWYDFGLYGSFWGLMNMDHLDSMS